MHIGRNAQCPCGSGKKYKRCCLLAPKENHHQESSPESLRGNLKNSALAHSHQTTKQDALDTRFMMNNSFETIYDRYLHVSTSYRLPKNELSSILKVLLIEIDRYTLHFKTNAEKLYVFTYHLKPHYSKTNKHQRAYFFLEDNYVMQTPDVIDMKENLRGAYYGWLTLNGKAFQSDLGETAAIISSQLGLKLKAGLHDQRKSKSNEIYEDAKFSGCLLSIPDQSRDNFSHSFHGDMNTPIASDYLDGILRSERLNEFQLYGLPLNMLTDYTEEIILRKNLKTTHGNSTWLQYNWYFCFKSDTIKNTNKEIAVSLSDIYFHPYFYKLPVHLRKALRDFYIERLKLAEDEARFTRWGYYNPKSRFNDVSFIENCYLIKHKSFARYLANLDNVSYDNETTKMFIADGIGFFLDYYDQDYKKKGRQQDILAITFNGREVIRNINVFNFAESESSLYMLNRKVKLHYDCDSQSYIFNHTHTINDSVIPLTDSLAYNRDTHEVIFANTMLENPVTHASRSPSIIKSTLNSSFKQPPIKVFPNSNNDQDNNKQTIEIINPLDIESTEDLSSYMRSVLSRCINQDIEIDLSSLEKSQVTEEDLQLHIKLSDENNLNKTFQLVVEKNGIPIKNNDYGFFSDLMYELVDGLQKGFGEYSHGMLRDFTCKNNLGKRHNELTLLRHCGFFRYVLQNTLEFIKKRQSDTHNPKTRKTSVSTDSKKFANKIIQDACILLELLPHHDATQEITQKDLKLVFSNKFLTVLTEEITRLIDIIEYKTQSFQPNGIHETLANHMLILPIIEIILKLYQHFQPINAFKKSRMSDVSVEHSFRYADTSQFMTYADEDQGLFITLKKMKDATFLPDVLTLFHNQSISGEKMKYRFTYNNQEIAELSESDIQGTITLHKEVGSDEQIDWFSLDPELFFKGKKVSAETFLKGLKGKFLEHEGQFYLINKKSLPTVKWLDFFWDQIHQQGLKKKRKKGIESHDHYVQQERSKTLELLALEQAGIPIIAGPWWNKIKEKFQELAQRTNLSVNDQAHFFESSLPLHNYQKIGVCWLNDLYDLSLGGILADDMGLGKTIQAIGFLKHLHDKNELGKSVIIVPTSLVYNWKTEIAKFAPELSVTCFESSSQLIADFAYSEHDENSKTNEPKLLIATYGQLLHNTDFFQNQQWHIAVFDEAQHIKNIVSQKAAAARKMTARMKIALTGTPMENHYGEFYSLIDLVVPGALGDFDTFKKKFKLSKSVAQNDIVDSRHLDFLKLKTKPLMLRRNKAEILHEIPEKTESDVVLDFDEEQAKIYRDVAISSNSEIQKIINEKGEAKSQLQMLSVLLKLRQICTSPQLIAISELKKNTKGTKFSYNHVSPKIERCLDMLEELTSNNESALVFTTFLTTIDLVTQHLKAKNIAYTIIHGQIPLKERAKILERFNTSPTPMVLIMTLKTGGVGLNLTKARYVLHLEPWWNPAVENQATDRVHRMGQKRSVYVYKFLMNKSVEEKIQTLKQRKSKLFDALLGSSQSIIENEDNQLTNLTPPPSQSATNSSPRLTKEDFQYLLET